MIVGYEGARTPISSSPGGPGGDLQAQNLDLWASTNYLYDENGNLKQVTDPRGGITKWTYYPSDQVQTVTDPMLHDTTYTYDTAGRPASVTERSGLKTTFSFDVLDRAATVKYGVSGTTQQSMITYGYDAKDRPQTLTDTAGGTTTLGYDVRDRVASSTGPKGPVTYTYDADSRVKTVTSGTQASATYTYNDAGDLTKVVQGTTSTTLGYDTAGRPATTTLPNGWQQTYGYDDASQLKDLTYTQAGTAKGALSYVYDATGRRRSVGGSLANVTLPAARSGLVYDAANKLTSAGTTTLTYDLDGNLTNDGSTAYSWDARGQLASLSRTGLTASFTYDALGDRSSRTVSGTATGFTLGGPNAATEQNGAGTTNATLQSGGVDQWFARTSGGVTDAVLTDALGSPIGLGAADGTMTASYSYDPYGVATATGTTHGSDLGFTGRQNDGTGLMYYRDRYYSPALQRFISEDPIGLAGGANLYGYAADSPTNLTDPSGDDPLVGCAIGALLGGGIDYARQRLSGRKVDWGWSGVGGMTLAGCAGGALLGFGGFPAAGEGEIGSAEEMAQALRNLLARRAGFNGTGQRIIVDENLPSAWAKALRGAGYDARSVTEIGLRGAPDSDLQQLARQLGSRVLTKDRGRQLDGGFAELAIQLDARIQSVDSVLMILAGL